MPRTCCAKRTASKSDCTALASPLLFLRDSAKALTDLIVHGQAKPFLSKCHLRHLNRLLPLLITVRGALGPKTSLKISSLDGALSSQKLCCNCSPTTPSWLMSAKIVTHLASAMAQSLSSSSSGFRSNFAKTHCSKRVFRITVRALTYFGTGLDRRDSVDHLAAVDSRQQGVHSRERWLSTLQMAELAARYYGGTSARSRFSCDFAPKRRPTNGLRRGKHRPPRPQKFPNMKPENALSSESYIVHKTALEALQSFYTHLV